MQLASEYILQDGDNSELNGENDHDHHKENLSNNNDIMTKSDIKNKIPSRASSGASSSGFLSYRQNRDSNQNSNSNNNSNNHNASRIERHKLKSNNSDRDMNQINEIRNSHNNSSNSLRTTLNNHIHDLSSDEGTGEEILDSSGRESRELKQNSHLRHLSTKDINPEHLDRVLIEKSLTEHELWQLQIKDAYPNLLSSLSDNEIKRQETIYEFIKTERSHMKNLLLMINVWKKGILNPIHKLKHIKIDRLLPGINELCYESKIFLNTLHERQINQYPIIENIGDVLCNHWQGRENSITQAFSNFCSLHGDALLYYKELIQNDKKFINFINEIRQQNITQRKDLTDCLNLAMQRITKYSMMVDKIKERTNNKAAEILDLEAAIDCISIIAERVDQEVKFVLKQKRLNQICKKLDSNKPTKTVGRKQSFGKSDLTYDKRRLLFESKALIKPTGLPSKPGKKMKEPVEGILLLMTDYLVMLKANNKDETKLIPNLLASKKDEDKSKDADNNKYGGLGTLGQPIFSESMKDNISYHFLNFPTGQPSVLPLRGLIIRENPTADTDRYLLSAAHAEVGLYELSFDSSNSAYTFAEQTRLAAQHCPDDINTDDVKNLASLSKEQISKSIKLREEEERSKKEYEQMVKKCDELMMVIKKCDMKIFDAMNQKERASQELESLKNPNAVPTSSHDPEEENIYKLIDNPEKIQVGPVIKECQSYLNDLNLNKDHKLYSLMNKAYSLSTQQDTALLNLRQENSKLSVRLNSYSSFSSGYSSVRGYSDNTDLNKMERIHEIESKRFDRLRKKDRDDLKKIQLQLELDRQDLNEQKRNLARQRDNIARQKSELDTETREKLEDLQNKEKTYIKQYEDELRKNAEQQRMLMKMRDMQRYIDELENKLEIHNDSSTNSPKSYASASPSNSFGQHDRNLIHSHYSTNYHNSTNSHNSQYSSNSARLHNDTSNSNTTASSSKRSNSHGAGDNSHQNSSHNNSNPTLLGPPSASHLPSHLNKNSPYFQNESSIRRGESLSPDRNNSNSNKHNRSKSNISSKSNSNSQNSSQNKIPERIGVIEKA